MIGVQAVDEIAEKLIETFPTDTRHRATDGPDNGKLEQALKPQCYLPPACSIQQNKQSIAATALLPQDR